jgi:hypothetical protein
MANDDWKRFEIYGATGIERVADMYAFQLWPTTSVKIKILERNHDFSAKVNFRKVGEPWIVVCGASAQEALDKALSALKGMFPEETSSVEWFDYRHF